MPDREWLRNRGRQLFEIIRANRVQFLIEVDLADGELDEMFRQLRTVELFASQPELRACLALAAIHAANRAEAGEVGFIEIFFTRLARVRDTQLWDETYGPAIVRFLHEVLQEPLRTGPYRYVGSVYRHAGVPRHGIGCFAALLQALTGSHGYQFTRHEYDACCEDTVSGAVSPFLKSEVGYEYACDSARVLDQIRSGVIRNTSLIPGYPSGFWTDLLARIQPVPGPRPQGSQTALPQLAIDTGTWALGVRIPARAIQQGVRCGLRRVSGEWDPIRPGEETYVVGLLSWPLPWSPSSGRSALFRAKDGVFVAEVDRAAVSPGVYILVQRWDVKPDPAIVEEDIGYCDWPGDTPLRAWRVRLRSGYTDDGVAVAGSLLPGLTFAPGRQDPALGSSVYLDSIPDLLVDDWCPEAGRLFVLCLEARGRLTTLKEPDSQGHVRITISCPAQGEVRLVPKGRCSIPSDRLPRLLFTVIPSAIRIRGPHQPVPIEHACTISAELPPDWSLAWDRLVAAPSPRQWTVPPHTWVLDGELSCAGISLRVSWRVPRVDVKLRTHYELPSIIWRDGFDLDSVIIIQAPPGTQCVINLRSPHREVLLWEAGPVPSTGSLTVRCITLRDALNTQTAAASELRLLAANSDYGTGVQWVSSFSALLDAFDSGVSRPFIEAIPVLGSCLGRLAAMRRGCVLQCSLELALKDTPLQRFVCDCGVLAAAIDDTRVEPAETELAHHASDVVNGLANWYRTANSAVGRPDDALRMHDAFPGGVESVPFPRWRDAVNGLLEKLIRVSNLPRLIDEWRNEVRGHALGPPVSLIRQRPEGEALTQGAVRYLRSFAAASDAQRLMKLKAATKLLREAMSSAEELVSQLATVLWWVALHRLQQRPADPSNSPVLAVWLAPAQQTLRRLFGFESVGTQAGGLHLRDVSPAEEDQEL